jgi:hypothetical protein
MSNLKVKYYFLDEIERIKMEEALVKVNSENEEEILMLDDYSIKNLYKKRTNEQSTC